MYNRISNLGLFMILSSFSVKRNVSASIFGRSKEETTLKEAMTVYNMMIGLQFQNYTIYEGRLADGRCCETSSTPNSCPEHTCDTTFSLCPVHPNASGCIFGMRTPPIFNTDRIIFGTKMGNDQNETNTFVVNVLPFSKENIQMVINAVQDFSESGNRGDIATFTFTIDWIEPFFQNPPDWHRLVIQDEQAELGIDVFRQCYKDYYGPKCDIHCKVEDGDHYTCLRNGTKKCKEGWSGPDCDDPVCPLGYCVNGGTCHVIYATPTCLCPPLYSGPQCEQLLDTDPKFDMMDTTLTTGPISSIDEPDTVPTYETTFTDTGLISINETKYVDTIPTSEYATTYADIVSTPKDEIAFADKVPTSIDESTYADIVPTSIDDTSVTDIVPTSIDDTSVTDRVPTFMDETIFATSDDQTGVKNTTSSSDTAFTDLASLFRDYTSPRAFDNTTLTETVPSVSSTLTIGSSKKAPASGTAVVADGFPSLSTESTIVDADFETTTSNSDTMIDKSATMTAYSTQNTSGSFKVTTLERSTLLSTVQSVTNSATHQTAETVLHTRFTHQPFSDTSINHSSDLYSDITTNVLDKTLHATGTFKGHDDVSWTQNAPNATPESYTETAKNTTDQAAESITLANMSNMTSKATVIGLAIALGLSQAVIIIGVLTFIAKWKKGSRIHPFNTPGDSAIDMPSSDSQCTSLHSKSREGSAFVWNNNFE